MITDQYDMQFRERKRSMPHDFWQTKVSIKSIFKNNLQYRCMAMYGCFDGITVIYTLTTMNLRWYSVNSILLIRKIFIQPLFVQIYDEIHLHENSKNDNVYQKQNFSLHMNEQSM